MLVIIRAIDAGLFILRDEMYQVYDYATAQFSKNDFAVARNRFRLIVRGFAAIAATEGPISEITSRSIGMRRRDWHVIRPTDIAAFSIPHG